MQTLFRTRTDPRPGPRTPPCARTVWHKTAMPKAVAVLGQYAYMDSLTFPSGQTLSRPPGSLKGWLSAHGFELIERPGADGERLYAVHMGDARPEALRAVHDL